MIVINHDFEGKLLMELKKADTLLFRGAETTQC